MSNFFTRNSRNIKDIENFPLAFNDQNDFLSDENGKVYVRSGERYICITDNIKKVNGLLPDENGELILPLPFVKSVNTILPKVNGDVTLPLPFVKTVNNTAPNGNGDITIPVIEETSYIFKNTDIINSDVVNVSGEIIKQGKIVTFTLRAELAGSPQNTFREIIKIPNIFRPKNTNNNFYVTLSIAQNNTTANTRKALVPATNDDGLGVNLKITTERIGNHYISGSWIGI
jgi:hypothetical protein